MIHYTCDVCGEAMPGNYVRPKTANGNNLLNMCRVQDVCEGCAQASRRLDVAAVILGAWRDQLRAGIPTEPKPAAQTTTKSRKVDLGEEKRNILGRLQRFRSAHKPGCLDAVAEKAGKTFTPELLRDVLLGQAVMPIDDWRKIGRALDKLGWETECVADG